jgi:outer membrane protein assembly factor BamD
MKKLLLLVVPAALIMMASCASGSKVKAKHLYDCSGKLSQAIEKYNKKRYTSAKDLLSDIISKCPGHSANDTTLYYLGKSWLGMKQPDEAKLEFEHLVQEFPNSAYNEEARFLLSYSSYLASNPWYLDQTSTKEAIRKLNSFIESNPQSPFADSARLYMAKCTDKLAQKEFEAARFYEKVARYESAIVYFKNIITGYPESPFALQSKLSMVNDLIALNRNSEAITAIDELLEQTKDDSIIKKASALRLKAEKKQL